MSCITIVGRERRWNLLCDVPLKHTAPEWTKTKMERIKLMMYSDDPAIRAIWAGHPRTTHSDILLALQDVDSRVRRAAVKNPSITEDLLIYASRDPDAGIAAYARLRLEEEEF